MAQKRARIALIRERHRKLILEPRRRMEYALVEDWEDEPLLDDTELVAASAQVATDDEDE